MKILETILLSVLLFILSSIIGMYAFVAFGPKPSLALKPEPTVPAVDVNTISGVPVDALNPGKGVMALGVNTIGDYTMLTVDAVGKLVMTCPTCPNKFCKEFACKMEIGPDNASMLLKECVCKTEKK